MSTKTHNGCAGVSCLWSHLPIGCCWLPCRERWQPAPRLSPTFTPIYLALCAHTECVKEILPRVCAWRRLGDLCAFRASRFYPCHQSGPGRKAQGWPVAALYKPHGGCFSAERSHGGLGSFLVRGLAHGLRPHVFEWALGIIKKKATLIWGQLVCAGRL